MILDSVAIQLQTLLVVDFAKKGGSDLLWFKFRVKEMPVTLLVEWVSNGGTNIHAKVPERKMATSKGVNSSAGAQLRSQSTPAI